MGATPVAPALIADISDDASWRYVEFFTANIRNPHTRRAHAPGVRPVPAWCNSAAPDASYVDISGEAKCE